MDYFFLSLPGDLVFKNGGDFSELLVVSFSQEMKHEKSSKKFGENANSGQIRDETSRNSGNFRSETSQRTRPY